MSLSYRCLHLFLFGDFAAASVTGTASGSVAVSGTGDAHASGPVCFSAAGDCYGGTVVGLAPLGSSHG